LPTPIPVWDVFCRVIDNWGDIGVCWRLSRQLAQAGVRVRLWVDDDSALSWMAPDHLAPSQPEQPGIEVLNWARASHSATLGALSPSSVWIEAFGCELPEPFVAQGVAWSQQQPGFTPRWINLEYLSAEDWVPRLHGLPSPVLRGPAQGWTKQFIYPGFTPGTGGLLREPELLGRQADFKPTPWLQALGLPHSDKRRRISLFSYEPPALAAWWAQLQTHGLAGQGVDVCVTPGRSWGAVQALGGLPTPANPDAPLSVQALPWLSQTEFDHLLWACDLNFVRGEDSLVRALWAGKPLVWQLYPQADLAHHAKLQAFLDWLQAPTSLRAFHASWNGMSNEALPRVDEVCLSEWGQCIAQARARLLAQPDLVSQLLAPRGGG
jgi:uncharacterized repeat protein (TIGR03837 family)